MNGVSACQCHVPYSCVGEMSDWMCVIRSLQEGASHLSSLIAAATLPTQSKAGKR
jgi:hypothetical protein